MKFEQREEHGTLRAYGLEMRKFTCMHEGMFVACLEIGEDGKDHHWVSWSVERGEKLFSRQNMTHAKRLLASQVPLAAVPREPMEEETL